jgi:hypothetical protein
MASSPLTNVDLGLRLVANGASSDHKRLRATLVVTPRSGGTGATKFETWTRDVVQLLTGGAVPLKLLRYDGSPIDVRPLQARFDAPAADAGALDALTTLWAASIGDASGGSANPFGDLLKDIDASGVGSRLVGAPQKQYAGDPAQAISTGVIQPNGALATNDHDPSSQTTIKGVVQNPQTLYSTQIEAARGQRVVRKLHFGPYQVGDQDEVLDSGDGNGYGSAPGQKDPNAAKQKAYQDRLNAMVAATDESRGDNSDVFDRVTDALKHGGILKSCSPTAAISPFAPSTHIVGRAPAASGDDDPLIDRAGHIYGAWPQWTSSYAEAARRTTSSDALAQLRAIYFTLQGDPILSRLFGFAFDISFLKPTGLAPGELIRLSADGVVWTAAALDESDGTARFWPAPRAYEGCPPTNVLGGEQANGVFKFGDGQHITALDVRGAVEGARDAVDRGGRHQTIGFSLLDSDAAARAARDLAVAEFLKASAIAGTEPIILYAEELTAGRKLDCGLAKTSGVDWRSLMTRVVNYPNLPMAARKRLEAVVSAFEPGGMTHSLILDESAFRTLSRMLPIVGGASDEQVVEAIVEEAFLTWDGTPLAALACRSTSDSTAGPGIMPVARTYNLLKDDAVAGRPWPLRYGFCYLFAMRAAYLGGGSPSLNEAQTLYKKAKKDAAGLSDVLPADTDGPLPKCFRRHEAIAAPQLLLPASLIAKTQGPMGFEPPTQATLRTSTDGDPVDPNYPDSDPNGPPYIPPKQRESGDVTYRLLLAPMAGFDFSARHGVFDVSEQWEDTLRGGLTDVAFLDEPDPGTTGKARHLGFPVAVVTRNTGFNADQLIYSRTIGKTGIAPAAGEAMGATVFESLGHVDKRTKGRGYFPDPAAQTMSLRVRVANSDQYLDTDVPIDLYPKTPKTVYPHALPVLVEIRRLAGPRGYLARVAADIIKPQGPRRFRFSPQATEESAGGVLVQHIIVNLHRGERYDIEATCLPKTPTLARWFSLVETIGTQIAAAAAKASDATALKESCGDKAYQRMTEVVGSFAHARTSGLAARMPPDHNGLTRIADELINCIRQHWPITELAAPTRLSVAHAVNAPDEAPRLLGVKIARVKSPVIQGQIILRDKPIAAVSPVYAPTPVNYSSDPGGTNFLLMGEIQVDLERVDGFEIRAQLIGSLGKPFDDPNRSRGILVKRAGRWPEVSEDKNGPRYVPKRAVLGFDVDQDGAVTLPAETVTLLRVHNLPDPRDAEWYSKELDPADYPINPFLGMNGRLARIDLGVLHQAALNGMTITLPVPTSAPQSSEQKVRTLSVARPNEISDTRARNVALFSVGVSRFAAAFSTAPMFSRDGTERVLARRRPLRAHDQSKTSGPTHVSAPATERPASPPVRIPETVFRINRCAEKCDALVIQKLERKCSVRLRFDRGWFSSGEDERLGIVLWPPRYLENPPSDDNLVQTYRAMSLPDFQDEDLGDGGQFISRWGGDPVRKDAEPQAGWFIPPAAFSFLDPAETNKDLHPPATARKWPHDPKYVASELMPIADKPGTSTGDLPTIKSWLAVSLLTFRPYFDIDAEEWFVDVPMSASRATDPFIRFGLVRYQENAIDATLRVSTPNRVWTQLPPRRELNVTGQMIGGDLAANIVVRGQASDGVKDLPDFADAEVGKRLAHPRMALTVLYETKDALGGRRQVDIGYVETKFDRPPPVVAGCFEWATGLTIQAERLQGLSGGQFVALVEEIEERLPATYSVEPKALKEAFAKDALVRAGPRFLARVPFWPIGN